MLTHPGQIDREADHVRKLFTVDVAVIQLRYHLIGHAVEGNLKRRQTTVAFRVFLNSGEE